MNRIILSALMLLNGCAHIGHDSDAVIAAENCYAYRYGDKIRKINFPKAFDWCHRSANLGNADSQTLLAEIYYLGLGGEVDADYATSWFEKAAKQGHAHTQYMLHRIYGKTNDPVLQERAGYWLKQASKV